MSNKGFDTSGGGTNHTIPGGSNNFIRLFLLAPVSLCVIVLLGNYITMPKAVLATLLIAWAVAVIIGVIVALVNKKKGKK